MAQEAHELFPNGGSATAKKRDITPVYLAETPANYIESLDSQHYGKFQDRLSQFLEGTRKALLVSNPTPRVFEIGALYGNSTLALTNGMCWKEACAFWMGDKKLRSEFRVSALDLSAPALSYGKRKGIFENTYVGDVNKEFSVEAKQSLKEADVLMCFMALNYTADGRWADLCAEFLQDRTKTKYILYSTVCAFDNREFYPEKLFTGLKNWSSEQTFCLHREFFEEEKAAHDGCNESWTYLYNVKFEKLHA